MAAHEQLLLSGAAMPLAVPRHRTMIRSLIVALVVMPSLAACGGGTPAKPTADDAATIAAAQTASVAATGASTSTSRTPVATGGATPAGISRSFGGLLTPARSTATTTGTRGTSTVSRGTGTASSTRASSTTSAGVATGTVAANASMQSPALDPCALLTPAEVSKAMGEPFSQFDNQDESPVTNMRFRGYSSATCVFAATASTQESVRAVEVGTIRRTPSTNPPTGSGTFSTIDDVWAYLKQQAQGSSNNSPSVLMGVGDEAFAIDDPSTPGDQDVFVRKGDIVLLVVVTGYDMGAQDKAIAVATQAVNKL